MELVPRCDTGPRLARRHRVGQLWARNLKPAQAQASYEHDQLVEKTLQYQTLEKGQFPREQGKQVIPHVKNALLDCTIHTKDTIVRVCHVQQQQRKVQVNATDVIRANTRMIVVMQVMAMQIAMYVP